MSNPTFQQQMQRCLAAGLCVVLLVTPSGYAAKSQTSRAFLASQMRPENIASAMTSREHLQESEAQTVYNYLRQFIAADLSLPETGILQKVKQPWLWLEPLIRFFFGSLTRHRQFNEVVGFAMAMGALDSDHRALAISLGLSAIIGMTWFERVILPRLPVGIRTPIETRIRDFRRATKEDNERWAKDKAMREGVPYVPEQPKENTGGQYLYDPQLLNKQKAVWLAVFKALNGRDEDFKVLGLLYDPEWLGESGMNYPVMAGFMDSAAGRQMRMMVIGNSFFVSLGYWSKGQSGDAPPQLLDWDTGTPLDAKERHEKMRAIHKLLLDKLGQNGYMALLNHLLVGTPAYEGYLSQNPLSQVDQLVLAILQEKATQDFEGKTAVIVGKGNGVISRELARYADKVYHFNENTAELAIEQQDAQFEQRGERVVGIVLDAEGNELQDWQPSEGETVDCVIVNLNGMNDSQARKLFEKLPSWQTAKTVIMAGLDRRNTNQEDIEQLINFLRELGFSVDFRKREAGTAFAFAAEKIAHSQTVSEIIGDPQRKHFVTVRGYNFVAHDLQFSYFQSEIEPNGNRNFFLPNIYDILMTNEELNGLRLLAEAVPKMPNAHVVIAVACPEAFAAVASQAGANMVTVICTIAGSVGTANDVLTDLERLVGKEMLADLLANVEFTDESLNDVLDEGGENMLVVTDLDLHPQFADAIETSLRSPEVTGIIVNGYSLSLSAARNREELLRAIEDKLSIAGAEIGRVVGSHCAMDQVESAVMSIYFKEPIVAGTIHSQESEIQNDHVITYGELAAGWDKIAAVNDPRDLLSLPVSDLYSARRLGKSGIVFMIFQDEQAEQAMLSRIAAHHVAGALGPTPANATQEESPAREYLFTVEEVIAYFEHARKSGTPVTDEEQALKDDLLSGGFIRVENNELSASPESAEVVLASLSPKSNGKKEKKMWQMVLIGTFLRELSLQNEVSDWWNALTWQKREKLARTVIATTTINGLEGNEIAGAMAAAALWTEGMNQNISAHLSGIYSAIYPEIRRIWEIMKESNLFKSLAGKGMAPRMALPAPVSSAIDVLALRSA